ncbi:hypothetical protein [Aquabacterium sp.]|uniref:hypothetical protein n=1 Tax=Aquabacterium sp. TaxID=1872578 RepID=UPI0019C7A8DE|nr:hypothetical protein [Aquabacterium sp.]MBC7699816.1 hypothetical protein [Aquabacterium sp.]
MKQRFDQVDAHSRAPTSAHSKGLASSPATTSHTGRAVATPAPTSGAWLSEALKLWCTEPHSPR